jgi:ATP-dependent RNA helicase RhlE
VTDSPFSILGINDALNRALAAENYVQPTPIQTQAIPLILAGRDVLGIAQTGTGKTAAFGLPLLQKLAEKPVSVQPRHARALILAPTRELVVQIDQSMRTYGRRLKLRHATILGGMSQNKQVSAMRNGVDVLVATPGRLLDLVAQNHVMLGKVELFVIDEADRMFDMGFIRDVRRIVACLPKQRQSLLFSATMPSDVVHLVRDVLREPVRIEVTPEAPAAERIDQQVYYVATPDKYTLLQDLLRNNPAMNRVVVFMRTKHSASKIAERLCKAGHTAEVIHGNKSQNARQSALDIFRAGKARLLVATDIAARGIDIDGVSHVVNFDLPDVAESYVHRIGRTARAGTDGTAIAFCDPSEFSSLRAIERLVNRTLTPMGGERPATGTPSRSKPKYRGSEGGYKPGGQKPCGQKPGQKPGKAKPFKARGRQARRAA